MSIDVIETAVRQVIVHGDPNTGVRKKIEYMTADEARAPGKENPFDVRGNQN
jgi:hypothetical protein